MRLLLIEDNERLARFITKGLESSGFSVDTCHTLDDGRVTLTTIRYNAIILDRGMPDGDGLDLLKELRQGNHSLPVLFLTARDGLEDRVDGLNSGADDYLVKPFAMNELSARINVLLRRPGNALGTILESGNLKLDTINREVSCNGIPALFNRRELMVLENLMRRAERVVSKDVLEENIYGFGEEIASNSIDVAVHRLRKRLKDVGAQARIETVRGVGYLLTEKTA